VLPADKCYVVVTTLSQKNINSDGKLEGPWPNTTWRINIAILVLFQCRDYSAGIIFVIPRLWPFLVYFKTGQSFTSVQQWQRDGRRRFPETFFYREGHARPRRTCFYSNWRLGWDSMEVRSRGAVLVEALHPRLAFWLTSESFIPRNVFESLPSRKCSC
jgi:hypothetical protein